MEKLPLDFSQPANRLTAIAEIERKKNIVKNDFIQQSNEYGTTNNKRLLKDIALKHQTINDILTVVRSMKYPIHEVVEETVYDRIDDDENFIDESKAPKKTMNVLKQYPYSFDEFFNPNLDLLKVLKYEK